MQELKPSITLVQWCVSGITIILLLMGREEVWCEEEEKFGGEHERLEVERERLRRGDEGRGWEGEIGGTRVGERGG